jgi:hypothetical protein
VVWNRTVKDEFRAGQGKMIWNRQGNNGRPVASGMYMIHMTVKQKGQKKLREYKTRIMCL